jgi:molybdopterin-guanine dinucleotide biosynthesis protein B
MEGLVRELSQEGYHVATVKHAHHGIELDREGKDSWRHHQAGAVVSIVSAPGSIAIFSRDQRELALDELCDQFARSVDLVLAEGYKETPHPKIVVLGNRPWSEAEWKGARAVVADRPLKLDLPVFKSSDLARIVNFIKDNFLSQP